MAEAPRWNEEATALIIDLVQCKAPPQFLWKEASGKVSLKVHGQIENFYPGDRIRFRSSFKPPRDFQNPGSFKAVYYYHSQGIVALGFLSDPAWIVRLPMGKGSQSRLDRLREKLRKDILAATRPEEGGFILSLLTGERYLLSKELEEAFQRSGVAHILSISGLHVTLVSFLFLILFRIVAILPLFSNSILAFRFYPLASSIPVWFYVALAHFPVPAIRAAVMITLFLGAFSFFKRLDLLSALYLAAFLILSISPLSFFSASFQLSCAAVLFLILYFPRYLKLRGNLWFLDVAAVSLIALLGVAPLLLFHFHVLSVVGLISNAVVVPLVNFCLMPFLVLGGLLSLLTEGGLFVFWHLVGKIASIILKIVSWFSLHSGWGLFYGAVSLRQILFYYAALLLPLAPKEFFSRKWRLALALLLMAMVLWGGKMPSNGKLRITFLDVGQGDAAVIQLPHGSVWVIDGGGLKGSDWDIGRFIVAPALWEKGVHRVEYLFLSHPHHDHYKGLGFLAQNFHPKVLFTNGEKAPAGEILEWETFLGRVEKGNVVIQKVTRASRPVEEEGVRLKFLAPGPHGAVSHFDTNDNSMVMRLSFGQVSFLFPGDLMASGEAVLLESKPDLGSQVLKVGHHGSDTSSTEEFLRAVQPSYAVMSVGAYNSYGMPGQGVMDRLKQKGIQLFRTDTQGAVTFTTDGEKIDVSTFTKK